MARKPGDSTVMMGFGAALKHAREAADMTQAELGKATDLDRTYISRIERGETNPSLTVIVALAKATGTAPGDLLKLL